MGTINYGNQTLSFDYKALGRSQVFNKIIYNLMPTGIYSGGTLSKVNSDTISVASLSCFIHDDSNKIGIKVETSESADISVTSNKPYIICQFGWQNVIHNYMDILSVTYDNIQDDNLILGKCIYKSGMLQSSFDYSRKTNPIVSNLKLDNDFLKIIPTEPYSNKVTVLEGKIIFTAGEIDVDEQTSPVVSNTVLGRIDLVYIDGSGDIQIEEGVDNTPPSMPSFGTKKVIAYITRGTASIEITGDDITLITGIEARIG